MEATSHAGLPIGLVDAFGDGADAPAGTARPAEQFHRGARGAGRTVLVPDRPSAPLAAQVLAQQLPGLRVDDPNHAPVPL